jgi:hypothetical protein
METQILVDLILDLKKDIGEIKHDISDLKDVSTENSVILDEHVRRCDSLEAQMVPMKNLMVEIKGIIKFLKIITIIISVAETLRHFFM